MPESNIDDYRIEQYVMRFVGYTTSSVTNPNPVEGESRTLCSGTAQVVNVRNFHLSKITWDCVSASLKSRVESRVEVRNTMSRVAAVQEVDAVRQTFESPNRPYDSDARLVVEQLNVGELRTEIVERDGIVRVNGKNLRKPQLVAKLREILEARRVAFANRQHQDNEASLKRKLEEMQAEKEATAKKCEELQKRIETIQNKGKSNSRSSGGQESTEDIMSELETRYGGSGDPVIVESSSVQGDSVMTDKDRYKEAVSMLEAGKSLSFLNSKEGLKWVTKVHEKICACEPYTIPAQFVRALANWDMRLINWAWFMDVEVQEVYDQRASEASFLSRQTQATVLAALLKEKMQAVRDPLFSEMVNGRESVPKFSEWERYTRRFGIPLVAKYIDKATGVAVSAKLSALVLEMESWMRQDHIGWDTIWDAYSTAMNAIQKEVNRGLCNSAAMARAMLHELGFKQKVFNKMFIRARLSTLVGTATEDTTPKKKPRLKPKSGGSESRENLMFDAIREALEESKDFNGSISNFINTSKACQHRDKEGTKVCFYACASTKVAARNGNLRDIKLCNRKQCSFSHKAAECWPTEKCMLGKCDCKLGTERRWKE